MKKIYTYLTILFLATPLAGMAQREIDIHDLKMVQSMEGITLDFTLETGSKAAPTGTTLILTPTLVNGMRSVELTPIVVRGRRAEILDRRDDIAAGRKAAAKVSEALRTRNDESVAYHAAFAFEDWMPGAKLILRGESEGCATCPMVETLVGTLVDDVMVPASAFIATEKVVVPGPVLSTADKLARHFSFIQPTTGGTNDSSLSPRRSRADGGLTVFFHQSDDKVVSDYRDNYRSLVDLLSAIEEIRRSDDCEIDRIAITGFASPEGTYESNLSLSERRANAMRRVIEQNAPSLASRIEVNAGGEDWDRLRELIAASPVPHKEEALRIIDTVPVWDAIRQRGRKGELMRLAGGDTYRYIARTLFPELREATLIIVYYRNKQ